MDPLKNEEQDDDLTKEQDMTIVFTCLHPQEAAVNILYFQ
jgi:hypothetical protein